MFGFLGTLARVFAPVVKTAQKIIHAAQAKVQVAQSTPTSPPQTTSATRAQSQSQSQKQQPVAQKEQQKVIRRDISQVSLRDIRDEIENPIYRSIKRKSQNMPEAVNATLQNSHSPQAAYSKLMAKWGRDEEMDTKALKALNLGRNQGVNGKIYIRTLSDDPFKKVRALVSNSDFTQIPPNSPANWLDYDQIDKMLPNLYQIAGRWNPDNSGLTDDAFVALMIANLHQEGRLQRRNPAVLTADPSRALRGIIDVAGDEAAWWLGVDSSLGIADIRPSVAYQIFSGQIPLSGPIQRLSGVASPYVTDQQMQAIFSQRSSSILTAWNEAIETPAGPSLTKAISPFVVNVLGEDNVSLELLGANIYRGIERAELAGATPDVFNISTWLQGGVQIEEEFYDPQNPSSPTGQAQKAIDHANAIIEYMNEIRMNPAAFGVTIIQGRDFQFYTDDQEKYVTSQNIGGSSLNPYGFG